MKRKIFSAFLCTFLFFCGLPTAWADETVPTKIDLIINNQLYVFAEDMSEPRIVNDRVYVPIRAISEGLGCPIAWRESTCQVVFGEPLDCCVENTTVSVQIIIYGEPLVTDSTTGEPFITDEGTTLVPIRAVTEALNCDVLWQDYVVIIIEKTVSADNNMQSNEQNNFTQNREQENIVEKQEFVDLPENIYDLTIMGESVVTAEQMKAFLRERELVIKNMMAKQYPEKIYQPIDENLVDLYLEIGAKYGVRGDLAFCQAIKETGYFQFYGSVQAFQNNFCGLGATGTALTGDEPLNGVDSQKAMYLPGLHGLTFSTAAYGVEAHIQHLYAYATNFDLPVGCELLDPRYKYVKRGQSLRWIDLNGRWAIPGNGYGEEIIDNYWQQMRLINE